MTTACGPVGGAPRRFAVTGRMRAVASAAGAAFCAAAEPTTVLAPTTSPAASVSPLMCLTAMLLSPRYVGEWDLTGSLPHPILPDGPQRIRAQAAVGTDEPLRRRRTALQLVIVMT